MNLLSSSSTNLRPSSSTNLRPSSLVYYSSASSSLLSSVFGEFFFRCGGLLLPLLQSVPPLLFPVVGSPSISGGPQQYRWMYPFQRFLCPLKEKIKNSRYVEGSIAEVFLVEEATKFASYYYPPEMISRWRGAPRNDDGGETSNQISIFNFPGRVVGKHFRLTLEGSDNYFSNWVKLENPLMSDSEVEQFTNSEFPRWF
ncbi:hypothetical protein K1719_020463 [Acacia pycnantha]|nr:hypothetical protein K1719_020463 [Acacia pycnantha]